ncbi:hypothetical protein NM688_g8427 [Phlebia brevispora]|uniref:Uncharacterized protein n=1 Tax=Phlebia brevispora TaxID=194682 RepID=A0ACC1RSW3_9APHY|nr:hypothetical protein NM688_g8427 [Phlebia brevispora]
MLAARFKAKHPWLKRSIRLPVPSFGTTNLPIMDSLPTDVVRHILSYLDRRDLVRLTLISRRHISRPREALYATLHINVFSPRSTLLHLLCVQEESTLIQTLQIPMPAQLVRHLTVIGTALAHPARQSLVCQALGHMDNLLSLDIAIRTFPDSIAPDVFREDVCRPATFLPNLLALKTDDVQLAIILVPGRPVYSVFVQDIVPEALRAPFMYALSKSKKPITQLQIKLDVATNDAASVAFDTIAAEFNRVSTLSLDLFISTPSERPLAWSSTKEIINRIGTATSSLYQLHAMSINIYPEAYLAQRETEEVKEVLELFRRYSQGIQYIEFKWHEWTLSAGLRRVECGAQSLRGQWAFKRHARS